MLKLKFKFLILVTLAVSLLPLNIAWANGVCDTATTLALCNKRKDCYWHNSRGGSIFWPFENYDDGGADNRFVCKNAAGKTGNGTKGCCLPRAALASVMTLNDFLSRSFNRSDPESPMGGGGGDMQSDYNAGFNAGYEAGLKDGAAGRGLK